MSWQQVKLTWVLSVILLLPSVVQAEEAPTTQRVEQLVQKYAFETTSKLNPQTRFRIRPLEVNDLWEQLELQAFNVDFLGPDGTAFNETSILYHEGKVSHLATSFGGYGLMSGLVHNGAFYFTYSWGSGVHRSHVVKLQIADGKLKRWESGGFMDLDLLVAAGPGGTVQVFSGERDDTGHLRQGKQIGIVEEAGPAELRIVDAGGRVVEPWITPPSQGADSGQRVRSR
jgi:hypothetical protein